MSPAPELVRLPAPIALSLAFEVGSAGMLVASPVLVKVDRLEGVGVKTSLGSSSSV